MSNPHLLPFLILGTVLITTLAFTVVVSVIIQKQRQNNNRLASQKLEFDHLQSLLTTRVEVREATLNMLARELHDNITQALTGCYMQLQASQSVSEPEQRALLLSEAKEHILTITRDVRLLSHSLATGMVEHRELQDAIQAELTRIETFTKIKCELSPDTLIELPPDQRLLMFRVVQEALQNVLKHANAGLIHVQLTADQASYQVRVSDDGQGFDPSVHLDKSFGMQSLRERLELLHGSMEIVSSSGNGTVITFQVPISQHYGAD